MLASLSRQSNGCGSSLHNDISTPSQWSGAMDDHRSVFVILTSAPAYLAASRPVTLPVVVPPALASLWQWELIATLRSGGGLEEAGLHSRASALFSGLDVRESCGRLEDGSVMLNWAMSKQSGGGGGGVWWGRQDLDIFVFEIAAANTKQCIWVRCCPRNVSARKMGHFKCYQRHWRKSQNEKNGRIFWGLFWVVGPCCYSVF